MRNQGAADLFEQEVRRFVRRGSKSPEFESQIKEIAVHYGDLLDEGIRNGISRSESEELAKKRIGDPIVIAFHILKTPSQVTRGIRDQNVGLTIVSAVVLIFLLSLPANSILPTNLAITFFVFAWTGFVLSSLKFGLGVFQARMVEWKSLQRATIVLLFGFGYLMLKYLEQIIVLRGGYPLNMTAIAFQAVTSTASIIGAFASIALAGFFIGRINIYRFSWFRLTRG